MERKSRRSHHTVVAGASKINASDLEGLRIAWRRKRLVLFLGAGVSAQWGIPTWKNLVLELLFDQTREARRLRGLWPHYRRALAEWLTDYFDYDPVILARVIKTDIRRRAARRPQHFPDVSREFLEGLREHLYEGYHHARLRSQPAAGRTSLDAVAELLRRSARGGHVAAVVTFNFDDLLERALRQRSVPHHVVHDDRRVDAAGIPIIHPHGFLPLEGEIPEAGIVFTEDDYHRLTDSVFHWALTRMVGFLREATVLFVGLSMSDPSLRRLLDASHRPRERPAHWQIQKRHEVKDHQRELVMQNVEERARRHGEILGDEELKNKDELRAAIDAVLHQADSYDRELFESMGVKTIWIKSFADIPELLTQIAGRTGR